MPYTLKSPSTEQEWADYFDLRWRILRAPWQQPPGSERDDLENVAYHLMAVDDNSKIIATGRLHRINEHSAQIRYMAVAMNFQGRSIGSQVLEKLEARARNWQCHEIALNARSSCLEFYSKHGYRVIGDAPTLFGNIRHKKMHKQLA